ncbi:BQ5605_C002g01223 [Microbotryum silenes-dioicae]|uniref:BQ5605_C002g01223 protein n=1 Tax=Microbotryum silenes-dioicae TaxID=796604 RepID=A0A2X0LY89_9BASI|nr:BQ5605_C002g01223 [Microbotryum silenes-dioicae]
MLSLTRSPTPGPPTKGPSLTTLPPELTLRCLEFAAAQAIVRVSETCRSLHTIARSELLWRQICVSIRTSDGGEPLSEPVRLGGKLVPRSKHLHPSSPPPPPPPATETDSVDRKSSAAQSSHRSDSAYLNDESITDYDGDGWWKQTSFLLPHSQHLGYWISSSPYTSRIVRLRTSLAETGTSAIPTLTITASQLIPRNLYHSLAHPPPILPHGCRRDGRDHASYYVPRRGPGSATPDRGLSVDILDPEYGWRDLFSINESSGALLSTAPYSGTSPDRFGQQLRLRLEKVIRDVLHSTGGYHNEQERSRQDADSLIRLFTGRAPIRPWPTEELVGVDLAPASTPTRRRGIFRGMNEWVLDRGQPRSVTQEVTEPRSPASSSSISLPRSVGDLADGTVPFDDPRLGSRTVVEGFHLQVRRKLTTLPGMFSRSPPRNVFGQFDPLGGPRVANAEVPYRPMRGPRGGPEILWNGGRDLDPDPHPGVAIIRAGGEVLGQPGGFMFHLQPETPLPTQPLQQEHNEEYHGEEIVRTDREEFYPIVAPSNTIKYGDTIPATVGPDGDILASSLEGLWIGTYGPHGLEFGYITVRLVASDTMPSVHPDATVYERQLEFCKVTGDANVPSGQISWAVPLSPIEEVASSIDQVNLGTIPSVRNEQLLQWSAFDPDDWNGSQEVPDWDQGTMEGWGRVAAVGFSNAGATPTQMIFIRSTETIEPPPDAPLEAETKRIDVVEEIRLRWTEMGKTAVFKRVRLPAR